MDEKAMGHGLSPVTGTILFRDRRLDQRIFFKSSGSSAPDLGHDSVLTTAGRPRPNARSGMKGIPVQFRR